MCDIWELVWLWLSGNSTTSQLISKLKLANAQKITIGYYTLSEPAIILRKLLTNFELGPLVRRVQTSHSITLAGRQLSYIPICISVGSFADIDLSVRKPSPDNVLTQAGLYAYTSTQLSTLLSYSPKRLNKLLGSEFAAIDLLLSTIDVCSLPIGLRFLGFVDESADIVHLPSSWQLVIVLQEYASYYAKLMRAGVSTNRIPMFVEAITRYIPDYVQKLELLGSSGASRTSNFGFLNTETLSAQPSEKTIIWRRWAKANKNPVRAKI